MPATAEPEPEEEGQLALFAAVDEIAAPLAAPELPPLVALPEPPLHRVRRLSFTSLSLFEQCAYKYFARYGLGIAYRDVNQLDRAADELRESLRIRPWDERAHFQLGNILSRQGELPEAIFHYEYALQLRPTNAVAHMNLAIDLIHLGKQPEARAHLDEAGRLDPQLRSTPNYQSALTALRSNP